MDTLEKDVLPGVPGNISLVGLMGSGKTSMGKVLARLLGKSFVDSDHEIERVTGVRIPVIFEIEGEAGFRARECKMIEELTSRENILLATGGGAARARSAASRTSRSTSRSTAWNSSAGTPRPISEFRRLSMGSDAGPNRSASRS